MDILFIRLASVGLIVLAPNPVACDGIVDILLPEEEGLTLRPRALFPDARPEFVEGDLR